MVVQREILKELREIVKSESMSMLLVTHDLHLARDVADRVSVMYAGYILETGPVPRVLPNPAHPYTEGLLDAMPDMESEKGTLQPIKGGNSAARQARSRLSICRSMPIDACAMSHDTSRDAAR